MRILRSGILALVALTFVSSSAQALINGLAADTQFPFVGSLGGRCTATKISAKWFITASHCLGSQSVTLTRAFEDKVIFNGETTTIRIDAFYSHESWVENCGPKGLIRCTGKEVGSDKMIPGRSDVALIHVENETPQIPSIDVSFETVHPSTVVSMVGQGCTNGIPKGAAKFGEMRFAEAKTLAGSALNHEHSLYRDIREITVASNIVTPGILLDPQAPSLCPGDSGGPLLVKVQGLYQVAGIAADYTFDGPYVDGAPSMTNLHTRLDDNSYHSIGTWIRETMKLGEAD